MKRPFRTFILVHLLALIALFIALPAQLQFQFNRWGLNVDQTLQIPQLSFQLLGREISSDLPLKKGLDIQGGMEVILEADMTQIAPEDRQVALESAREVILRRVDMFGISEPQVTASRVGDKYRLLADLPGVTNINQALNLVGTTAQLDFRLLPESAETEEATYSASTFLNQFEPTELTGKQLKRASVQFQQQTNEPVISLEFDQKGQELFAEITQNNVGQVLAIFLDEFPVALPRIEGPIYDGRAVMTGGFALEQAKQLAIQLNAGALPVPIKVIEQKQLGASLGQEAVKQSVLAGVVGIILVMIYMVLLYGGKGLIADWALLIYGILTVAGYKVFGVTLTLPGIAGLLLTIGMAVDANILIFERMKEELRLGKPWRRAMELGFGRAWDSIKDANLATITIALVLINPFDFSFLNTSGLVRGFGITLLIGVLLSLFTGVVVTRTLMRMFIKQKKQEQS